MVQFCYSVLHLGTETDSKCLLKRWVRKKKFTNNIGETVINVEVAINEHSNSSNDSDSEPAHHLINDRGAVENIYNKEE